MFTASYLGLERLQLLLRLQPQTTGLLRRLSGLRRTLLQLCADTALPSAWLPDEDCATPMYENSLTVQSIVILVAILMQTTPSLHMR